MKKIYQLPPLPFKPAQLAQLMSKQTIEYHHGKHHRAYVDKTNELLADAPGDLTQMDTVQMMAVAEGPLRNNLAQAWNHTFLWYSLAGKRSRLEASNLFTERLKRSFGSLVQCSRRFAEKGKGHFGSGWLWLVKKPGDSAPMGWEDFHDAENPAQHGLIPLLACDLWEHAYYLDYKNDRGSYLKDFFQYLNWEFAAENFQRSTVCDLDPVLRVDHGKGTKKAKKVSRPAA